MMKLKLLLLSIFLLSVSSFAQYPLKSIKDIQTGTKFGDTVRVRGIVLARPLIDPVKDRRPIVWAGARWTTYIQDEDGQLNGGIFVLQEDTTNKDTGFDLLDTAQVVEFTGYTVNYTANNASQTELMLITKPSAIQVNPIKTLPSRPAPIEVKISDLQLNGTPTAEGPKYEGMYIIIRNVTTSNRNTTNGTFTINDADGHTMNIYDQSGYFSTRSNHALSSSYTPPLDNTKLSYIKGVVYTRQTEIQLVPIYPEDMKIGSFPPSIKELKRNIGKVAPDQPVEISANITDVDNKVAEANIFYRVNGSAYKSLAMTAGSATDSIYKVTLPGVKDSALVDYFVQAKDETGFISRYPADTAKNNFIYLVLNREPRIQDVQYSPYGGGHGGYETFQVTLTGVVTTDTTDIPGTGGASGETPRVFMQNGSGPWSGIWVYGQKAYNLRRGDNVTVTGTITENGSNTTIEVSADPIVNSKNNPLPQPVSLSTADIAAKSNGTVLAEQYESVLVKYSDLTVSAENADGKPGPSVSGNYNYGELLVADKSGTGTRVELQDGNHKYNNYWDDLVIKTPGSVRIQTGDKFTSLTGVLVYSFSNYKLFPRKNDDFVGYQTDVNPSPAAKVSQYNLTQNFPNPFNPSTVIQYSIPKDGFVTLKVYNMLGREIKTLVNQYQGTGTYKISFDGSELPSGIYLYKIDSGNFSSIKKMILIK